MTAAVAMPARRWGDEDEPEPVRPTVRVSSRAGAPIPHVAAAARLAELATAHGWRVVQTYALADWPAQFYLNGRLKKAAHELASVAVRMSRREPVIEHGFAIWHRENEGGWRFACAFVQGDRYGAKSIVERVAR